MYKVGDKVVYPHHGAGTVVKKESRTVLGQKREYMTIKILHNDMTVNVPTENADRVGLRKVIDEEMVERVVKVLHGNGTKMPKNWNQTVAPAKPVRPLGRHRKRRLSCSCSPEQLTK